MVEVAELVHIGGVTARYVRDLLAPRDRFQARVGALGIDLVEYGALVRETTGDTEGLRVAREPEVDATGDSVSAPPVATSNAKNGRRPARTDRRLHGIHRGRGGRR